MKKILLTFSLHLITISAMISFAVLFFFTHTQITQAFAVVQFPPVNSCLCQGYKPTIPAGACTPDPNFWPPLALPVCGYCNPTDGCVTTNECCCAPNQHLLNGSCVPNITISCDPIIMACEPWGWCCYEPPLCMCPPGEEWDNCGCEPIDTNEVLVEFADDNYCVSQGSDNLYLERSVLVCSNNNCAPQEANTRYYSIVQEGSCADFNGLSPTWPGQANVSDIWHETINTTVPNTNNTYCITSVANYTNLALHIFNRWTGPQQILCSPQNQAPDAPVIEFVNSVKVGSVDYLGGNPDRMNEIRVTASDPDGSSDIEQLLLGNWSQQTFPFDEKTPPLFLLSFNSHEQMFYITTPSTPSAGELIGMNGGAIFYEDNNIVINYATEYINASDQMVLTYRIYYKRPPATTNNIKDVFGARTVDLSDDKTNAFERIYLDTSPPTSEVLYPSTTGNIKSSSPTEQHLINLEWYNPVDSQPTSAVAPNSLTVAYVKPSNCISGSCEINDQAYIRIANNAGVYTIYHLLGELPYMTTNASVYEVPYAQVIASGLTTNPADATFGEYAWDTQLNQRDVNIITGLRDNIYNYGSLASEKVNIDSVAPVVFPILNIAYSNGTPYQNASISFNWQRSTDDVSGVKQYVLRRIHERNTTINFDPTLPPTSPYFVFNDNPANLPPQVTFSSNRYNYKDGNRNNALDTVEPLLVNPVGDGSPTHNVDEWSDERSITLEWRMDYDIVDEYTYQVFTYDNVDWYAYSDPVKVTAEDPIRNYKVIYELDRNAPYASDIAHNEVVYNGQVAHIGPQDDSTIQRTTFNDMENGAWFIHIKAYDSDNETSTDERILGPYLIGNVSPAIEFDKIAGFKNNELLEYKFSLEDDPNNPNKKIPTAHSTFALLNLFVNTTSNIPSNDIDSVTITKINGEDVVSPSTYTFDDLGNNLFEYDHEQTGALQLDTSLRFNRITVKSVDTAGMNATKDCIIEYIPESHIDVRVTADYSSAFTLDQIDFDNGLEEGDEEVLFTTTVFSPGAKGLSGSYYSDGNWESLNKNFIVDSFNAGSIMGDSEEYVRRGERRTKIIADSSARSMLTNLAGVDIDDIYSVKWEGRIKAPETGRYYFDIELGANDYVEIKFDQHAPFILKHTGEPASVETDLTLRGDEPDNDVPLFLEQGVWYGITVNYIGDYSPTEQYDDVIRIKWKYERDGAITECMAPIDECTEHHFSAPKTITKENLTFNAGNVSRIIDDFTVNVTMPEGISYLPKDTWPRIQYKDDRGAMHYITDATPIILKPSTISPTEISEDNQIQTLTWNFTTPSTTSSNSIPIKISTVIPVGESLMIQHYGKAEFTRLIGPQEE